MTVVFRALALLLLVVCAVWLPVLWHWQHTRRDVSTADVVYWLVVLPALLFAACVLLRWAWRAVVLPGMAQASPNASPAPAQAPGPNAPADARAGSRPALLLASAVNLPGATGVEALDEALREQTVQPGPDAELTNHEGLPLHTARCELSMDVVAHDPAIAQASPRTARALATLMSVMQDLAAGWPVRPAAEGDLPAVRLLVHLPDEVAGAERESAHAWLQAQAPAWLEGIARVVEVRLHGGPGVGLWQHAESVLAVLERERRPDLLLVAAAQSELDPDLLDRWNTEQRLFDAQRAPRGRMAGEGAAALLVASASWARQGGVRGEASSALPEPASAAVLACLHRAVRTERSQPVDAPGRVNSEALEHTMSAVLAAQGLLPEGVQALCCDVDRHGVRNGELFAAVIARLPHLDAIQDVRALAAGCGHQGTVGLLANVALAAHGVAQPRADDSDRPSPCLVLHLDDPRWRLGLLVSAPEPSPVSV